MTVWIFSPTRKIIDLWKQGDKTHRGRTLRRWSLSLFLIEIFGLISLSTFATSPPSHTSYLLSALPIIYAYSRINEIVYAFYRDSLSQSKASDLESGERIRMAMRSYFGLAFNFALLYYFMPISGLFKEPLASFFEAFYFSSVTLTTLGYGDLTPVHWLSRLLSLYEVFAGILLLAVAVATYIGGLKENNS